MVHTIGGCDLLPNLVKVTNKLYPKSHLNQAVNIQSGLGLSGLGQGLGLGVVGEKLDGVGPVDNRPSTD